VTTTAIDNVRFRPLGRGTFIGGFFVTLAIHAALGALVWYGSMKAAEPELRERPIMITQRIQFGVKREKFWLPRISEPPPPKVEDPVIKVTEDLNAAPVKKEEEKEKPKEKPQDLSKKVQEMLKRRKAMFDNPDPVVEGDPNGDRNSTSSTATEGDPYATAIYDAIKQNWNVPTGLNLGQVLNLEAVIKVRIGDDGTLLEPTLGHSSGSGLFDDSCLQAVQATRRVPPPPASQRSKYRRGLNLVFDGKSLAH
jgi:TonB family protein